MENEYMVCAGFSVLLVELLKSVDIEATTISIKVDVSYDDGFTVEEKPGQLEGHRRVFVHLNDSKYGIDGYYNADPTRDNNMEKSLYVHSSMTIEETSQENRTQKIDYIDYIFIVHDMQVFNKKVNALIDKIIQKNTSSNNQIQPDYSYKKVELL